MSEHVPPIPASCADRPTAGGLVVPYINVQLADGGADFRSPNNTRYEQVWQHALCQTCAHPLDDPDRPPGVALAVFFGGPNQLADLTFDEPPLCTGCAVYASKACPMIAGRRTHYADRPRLAAGHRGARCDVPECGCAGWIETVKGAPDGGPAHPWYAVYARVGFWELVGTHDWMPGYATKRIAIAGGRLTAPPVKVIHVSDPGDGRVWKRLEGSSACPVTVAPTTLTN